MIRHRSANKPSKDADEEQSISISFTSEGSSEHGEFEHRQQKVRKELEFIADSNKDVGKNDIVTFEGACESRPVAVKRMESCQIQLLIESDYPPNIIRFHDVMECDRDFINHAMENLIFMSLDDLVKICLNSTPMTVQPNGRLESLKKIVGDVKLVAENGHPSPLLQKLFREILFGVSHLHDKLRIAHGCLNPESILIGLEGSFNKLKKGCRDSDWRALHQRQTWEKDLGRILYYCITGSKTVKKNQRGLAMVKCPEVLHLISLLNSKQRASPKAIELLQHPLLWNSEKRLSFLRDTSERVGDPQYSNLLKELRNIAVHKVISTGESWKEQIDDNIITHMNKKLKHKQKINTVKKTEKQRSGYNYCSVRDLVRFIRNMLVHYGQLPTHIQRSVGILYKGFDSYFTSRFPKLLIEVYKVVCRYCKEDEYFGRYFDRDMIF